MREAINKCKLCNEEKILCNSHIIPQFFFSYILTDSKIAFVEKGNSYEKSSNGYKEKLLCLDCETKIGKHEKYVSETLLDIRNEKRAYYTDDNFNIYDNISYFHFKLFALSLVWKSSISSLEFYSNIELNERHEENMRLMLLNNDPREENTYPILIFRIENDKTNPLSDEDLYLSIKTPHTSKLKSHHSYSIIAGGFAFTIIASSHMQQLEPHYNCIKKDNSLYIPKLMVSKNYLINSALKLLNSKRIKGHKKTIIIG